MVDVTADTATVKPQGENSQELKSQARREDLQLFGLTIPVILIHILALVLPISLMIIFSFIGKDGSFSLEHYQRIWERPVYVKILRITFTVSLLTTFFVVILGYPLSYFLAQLPDRLASILMMGVLLPFLTAVLVRTYAWLVLLQNKGLINNTLIDLGIISEPLQLVHNMTGTLIGMVHVMLPFLVLPLYASMKAIDANLMSAASNLGARPLRAFWDVYFPLSLPGLLSGALMVFVLCLGYFVTPATLGGGTVIMVAMRIEANIRLYSSWGAASALGVILMLLTGLLLLCAYWISKRGLRRAG